jgi:hypothetical protein
MKPPTGPRETPGAERPAADVRDASGAEPPSDGVGETPGTERPAREMPGIERLADRIAEAVASCPDVVSMPRGPVATYLSGRTVPGVAVRDTEVEVAVVVRYGRPLTEIAADVRGAVAALAPGLPVHVRITDIAEPGTGPGSRTENEIRPPASDAASPKGPGDTPVSR